MPNQTNQVHGESRCSEANSPMVQHPLGSRRGSDTITSSKGRWVRPDHWTGLPTGNCCVEFPVPTWYSRMLCPNTTDDHKPGNRNGLIWNWSETRQRPTLDTSEQVRRTALIEDDVDVPADSLQRLPSCKSNQETNGRLAKAAWLMNEDWVNCPSCIVADSAYGEVGRRKPYMGYTAR